MAPERRGTTRAREKEAEETDTQRERERERERERDKESKTHTHTHTHTHSRTGTETELTLERPRETERQLSFPDVGGGGADNITYSAGSCSDVGGVSYERGGWPERGWGVGGGGGVTGLNLILINYFIH